MWKLLSIDNLYICNKSVYLFTYLIFMGLSLGLFYVSEWSFMDEWFFTKKDSFLNICKKKEKSMLKCCVPLASLIEHLDEKCKYQQLTLSLLNFLHMMDYILFYFFFFFFFSMWIYYACLSWFPLLPYFSVNVDLFYFFLFLPLCSLPSL